MAMRETTFQTEERAREIDRLGRPFRSFEERDAAREAHRAEQKRHMNRHTAIDFLTRVPRPWTVEELTAEADKLIAYLEGTA